MSVIELGCAFAERNIRVRFSVAGVVLCTLSGCAALSPQIFSDRLSPPLMQSGPSAVNTTQVTVPTVASARDDVESVQKKYARAIQDLSNITPRTSAALIGLSAAALYKGLTGGSTKGIAALGVLGSGIWAYGATMTSQPRQRVYGEGIRALSCAVTAASPYDRDSTWIAELKDEIKGTALAFEDLREWQETYADLNTPQTIPGTKAPARSEDCTNATIQNSCKSIDPGSPSASNEKLLQECGELKDRCKSVAGTKDKVVAAPKEITDAVQRAKDEQARLALAISNGRTLQGTLEVAGSTLQDRSTEIQVKVSAEVLKTEPDPTAVLATLKNLKQVASAVSGVTLTAPPVNGQTGAGGAQGAKTSPPSSEPALAQTHESEIKAAVEDLRKRLKSSYTARVLLESRLAEVDGSIRKVNRALDQCEFTAPGGIALVVSPSATSIELPLGSSQSFTVSGGTGVPLASVNGVAGAKVSALPEPRVDRGTFNFIYTAPADGHVGDQAIVMFTDASHQGAHEVTLTATAAALPSDKAAAKPSAGGTKQPLSEDIPPTPSGK
jgi:hypothetical protein